jgi:hypothetical protein
MKVSEFGFFDFFVLVDGQMKLVWLFGNHTPNITV